MAGGYRSAQPLLGLSAPPVTVQGGYRSLLFYWGGGAASKPVTVQGGYRSLLAFWCGGAFSGTQVPPVPPVPPSYSRDGHGKQWKPIQDITSRRLKDDNEIALWLAHFISSID